jgi:RNA polymerase sigma factor (sigma-70 family)
MTPRISDTRLCSSEECDLANDSADQPWKELTVADLATSPNSTVGNIVKGLVVGVISGNHFAVEKFTTLVQPAIDKLAGGSKASRLLKPYVEKQDLSQWAWLYVVGGLRVDHKFKYHHNALPLSKWVSDPQISLSAYVASVVRGYLMDCVRTIFRSRIAATVPLIEEGFSVEAGRAVTCDLKLLIATCWPKLSDQEREVLSLRFHEGLSLTQVAKIVGKSPSTIQRWEHRGLQSLKSFLTRGR